MHGLEILNCWLGQIQVLVSLSLCSYTSADIPGVLYESAVLCPLLKSHRCLEFIDPPPLKNYVGSFLSLNHFIQVSVLGTGDTAVGGKKSPCSK